MLKTSDQPLPTGDLAYRIVLHLDKIKDAELKEWIANPRVHFWIGPHSHAVAYSIRSSTMYNIVLLCPDDLPQGLSRATGSVEQVDKCKLMHRQELESWTNRDKNFVLLGDSCHPMLPCLTQGANWSIKDGGVLGRLLSYMRTREQLLWAITLYERLRKPRSKKIARETFLQRGAPYPRRS
ncbi:hypothetical protein FOPE_02146 [Fonsecaea pedrosoi]|nr:hypothetical protein FOPE_02146 [Fonsecaea pedrosoi]